MHKKTVLDRIVKSTADALLLANGNVVIHTLAKNDLAQRCKLERAFARQIGISPKQMGRVIRFQAAVKTLLGKRYGDLIQIAYDNQYYDQAHFNKDFKALTGVSPGQFLGEEALALSKILYSPE